MAISSMENPQDPECGGSNFYSVLIVDDNKGCDDDDNDCHKKNTIGMDSTNSSLSSESEAFSSSVSFATSSPAMPLHLDDRHLVVVVSPDNSFYHEQQEHYNNRQQHPHEAQEYHDPDDDGKHESYSSFYPLKRKPSRTLLYLRNRLFHAKSPRANSSHTTRVAYGLSLLLSILLGHRLFSLYMTHRQWINAPITYMTRPCDAPPYETITSSSSLSSRSLGSSLNEDDSANTDNNSNNETEVNICITTLTDSQSTSTLQRFLRWRNFDGILELTWQNKLAYATKHGYHFIDASAASLDPSRPPAWSKIPAVQRLLQPPDATDSSSLPHCDWVMWTDADTVFMNSQRKIEDFLPISTATQDLLVARDNGSGYNSGVFLLRNTDWSRQLLHDWWNMVPYVRPPGLSLSGDNAALKALLANMPDAYFQQHVLVPSRCTFNAFAKFLTISESQNVMQQQPPGNVLLQQQPWYLSQDYYHKGDFLAHAPGYDNKAECLRLLLQEAR